MTSPPSTRLLQLDREQCLELLCAGRIGRLAVTLEGQPHIVPVNYFAAADGTVVFRTSADTVLSRVDLQRVAFEIDGIDEAAHSGWSVSVHGVGRELTAQEDAETLRLRALLIDVWAPGDRSRVFAVEPEELTGRRLEGALDDDSWMAGLPWS
jgi:nitroimidazol reductase NimA-like FMN-containing flavoprotein (pyridoxamine 5'-phosphate oxidase superfamily)